MTDKKRGENVVALPGAGEISSMNSLQAAQRIDVLLQTAQAIGQMIHAQLMEALWVIRREHDDQPEFERFVQNHTQLEPAKAWAMAQTWDIARHNRDLRELAQHRPHAAMSLVADFAEYGVDLSDESDEDVVRLLSLSPRKRNRELRKLIDQASGAADPASTASAADPDTPAPPAIVAEVVSIEHSARAQIKSVCDRLYDIVKAAHLVRRDISPALAAQSSQAERERMLHASDQAIDHLEEINGQIFLATPQPELD